MSRLLMLSICALILSNCKAIKIRKLSAIEEAEKLKESALLVRLKTGHNKIAKLREMGMKNRAEQVEWEISENNKEVIQAFKEYFEFAPVYFFFSNNSQNVRDGNMEGIFVNEDLEIDESISYSGDYLIAEFGRTQGEQMIDNSGKVIGATTGSGIYALVILNEKFNQIARPFPYAQQVSSDAGLQEKSKAVYMLNQDLFYFFYEGQRWKARKRLIEYD